MNYPFYIAILFYFLFSGITLFDLVLLGFLSLDNGGSGLLLFFLFLLLLVLLVVLLLVRIRSVIRGTCLEVLCAHLEELKEPLPVHEHKHDKEQVRRDETICDVEIDVPVLESSVPARVRNLHGEDIQSENDPNDHSGGVDKHHELAELSVRHDSQQADENVTNVMHKHHRGSNSRRVHDEIRHRDKGSGGEVVDDHGNKVGPPYLEEGEHDRVEVVPQLEHVVLLHPGDKRREGELIEGEVCNTAEDPPGLAVEDEEGDDGHGPVENELPELAGEPLDVHLKVLPFVAVLGNQNAAEGAEKGNTDDAEDGNERVGDERIDEISGSGIRGVNGSATGDLVTRIPLKKVCDLEELTMKEEVLFYQKR